MASVYSHMGLKVCPGKSAQLLCVDLGLMLDTLQIQDHHPRVAVRKVRSTCPDGCNAHVVSGIRFTDPKVLMWYYSCPGHVGAAYSRWCYTVQITSVIWTLDVSRSDDLGKIRPQHAFPMRRQSGISAEDIAQGGVDPAEGVVEESVGVGEDLCVEDGGFVRGGEEAITVCLGGASEEGSFEGGEGRFGVGIEGNCVEEAAAGGREDLRLSGGADLLEEGRADEDVAGGGVDVESF